MPLTRPPAPPVPPTRTAPPAPPVAPRTMAPPPQRAAAPVAAPTRVVQGPATNGVPPARPVAQQAQTALPKSVPVTQPTDDLAIRSAKLRFYTAGAAYFESQMNATVSVAKAAPVARPSASAPSAATAQKVVTPAVDGTVKRPVGRPPGRPPALPPTQQAPAPVQPATPTPPVAAQSISPGEVPSAGVLAGMTRKDLVEMAKGMGLETQGVKGDDLRVMIANSGGGAPAQEESESAEDVPIASANEQYMEARALINIQLIEANLDKFEDMIDPNSTNPDALKCGGDCIRCPNPGNYPLPADQVAFCYKELHNDLGLGQEFPVEAVA